MMSVRIVSDWTRVPVPELLPGTSAPIVEVLHEELIYSIRFVPFRGEFKAVIRTVVAVNF